MTLVWLDYFYLAGALNRAATAPTLEDGDGPWAHELRNLKEACLLSAISRAYYAAFNGARLYLRQQRPEVHVPRDGTAHVLVWETLERGTSRERAAAIGGKRLKVQRTNADYHRAQIVNLKGEATKALQCAEDILRALGATNESADFGTPPVQ